jgi:hypothetical protein
VDDEEMAPGFLYILNINFLENIPFKKNFLENMVTMQCHAFCENKLNTMAPST